MGPEHPLRAGGGEWGWPPRISVRPLRCPPRIVPVGVRQVGGSTDLRPWWVSEPQMGWASPCWVARPAVQPQGSTSCKLVGQPLLFHPALGAEVLLPSSVGTRPQLRAPCHPASPPRPGPGFCTPLQALSWKRLVLGGMSVSALPPPGQGGL